MSDDTAVEPPTGFVGQLRGVVWGRSDPRVRAVWRVLLAMPIFWWFAGGLAGTLQAVLAPIPAGGERFSGLALSVLHGGLVVVILLGWARYVDRRPLSNYGVRASKSWLLGLLGGFGAVFLAFVVWFGLGVTMGWATVDVSLTAPRGSLVVALALTVLALAITVWIQQLVFFRIILGNAAEGLHSHDVDARRAVLAAVVVAIPFFVVMHQLSFSIRLLDLAIAGGIYGLLYVQTGDIATSIGVHLGVFIAGQRLFVSAERVAETASVFAVTQSVPDSLRVLTAYGFPKLLLAYCAVLVWLQLRRGEIPVDSAIAR